QLIVDNIRVSYFFFQAEDGIRDFHVTGVQTCALPISFAAVAGDTEKHIEAKRIERTIDALTVKIRQETQINKRQSLARERHELRSEERRVGKGCRSRWRPDHRNE